MNKLFNNPPVAIIGILCVLTLFISYKCSATELEVGATYTSGFNGGYGISVMERLGDKIDLGITLVSEQSWEKVNVTNNGNVWFAFVAEKPKSWVRIAPDEIHIGAAKWIKAQSPINGCEQGFLLGFKYRFKDFSIGWRHWSNAGSCPPNRGQDMLTVGWRF